RHRLSLCPLYVALGVMQPISVQLAANFYFEVFPGIVTNTGSAVLFTSSLFALLLVYIREDAAEARKVVYALTLSNLVVACLYLLISKQIELDGIESPFGLWVRMFQVEGLVMVVGTVLLFADAILLILLYELLGRFVQRPLFLRAWLALAVVLAFDSAVFTLAVLPSSADRMAMLLGGIVAKCFTGLIFAFGLHVYLRWLEPAVEAQPAPLRDVFEVLTYREKFQREQVEAARFRVEQEARQEAIMKALPDGLLVCQGARVLEMNAAAATIFGRTAEAGTSIDDWVAPAGALHGIREEALQRSSAVVPRSYQVRVVRPDRKEVPVEIVAASTRLDADEVFVLVVRDIGERLGIERRLREAERMNALGGLAAGVAHDFNNILTAISGAAELTEIGEGSEENLQVIRQAVSSAAALTRQLLTISREGELRRGPLAVGKSIDELRPLFTRIVREDIDLTFEVNADAVVVHAALSELQQILMNLVVNAVQAIEGAGRIRVSVTARELREPLPTRLATLPVGRYAVLEVADTGRGMDEQTAARAFEPFFTTKANLTGSGLGLATVTRITDSLQGGILLESSPGKGTKLSVLVPAIGASPPSPSVQPTHRDAAHRDHETLLVCEDDPAIARITSLLLQNAHFVVHVATSASEALAWIRSHGASLDVLVTDMVMPQMSGRGLASAARRMYPDLGVVYVTGYLDDPASITGAARGAVVTKPFLGGALVDAVRQSVAEGRAIAEGRGRAGGD
ncbi:MAG: ATP-binding protein, partial [Planctomycetota bacterium]